MVTGYIQYYPKPPNIVSKGACIGSSGIGRGDPHLHFGVSEDFNLSNSAEYVGVRKLLKLSIGQEW
jgi:hypothetical protein